MKEKGETINILSFNLLKIVISLGLFVCLVTACGAGGSRDDGTETLSPTTPAVAAQEDLVFRLAVTNDEGAKDSDEVTVYVEDVLLSDDFSNGDINNWIGNSVDDSGGIGNSSKWEIVSGELRQNYFVANIELGDPYDESYHRGTFTYPNTGMSWQDYRFSVDVTPLPDTGLAVQGNDVGVMFRYQGINNYYRLTLSARYGFTRLEKKVAGSFSTLAVDSRGYYENVTLKFIIEVKGSLIQVFLGDEPLFSVTDSDLDSGTIGLYCQDKVTFDNVLVTQNNPAPSIIISSPADYSVITTSALDVSALATNVPPGASVDFVLDDGPPTVDSTPPYEVQFATVSQGEHKVDAILRDSLGAVLAQDSNIVIGVVGDYYVAIGDSITNGYGDDDPSDNTSQDGRIIANQGYEANLNDLLTSKLNYPHIVFNEGIGGDTSLEALGRINSILERHPQSNKALILLGTNDSARGVFANTFRDRMQSLVNTVVSSGKEAWVALVLPVFNPDGTPNNSRNQLIEQYNDVIMNQLSNVAVGPDFYNFFLDKFYTHYVDTEHPNGLGYAAMANEWHDLLALPFAHLVYTPVPSCRIVDTSLAGGPIWHMESYNVWGDVDSQGGNPAGCPSPLGEPQAVHLKVTAVPVYGSGGILAFPYGQTAPGDSLISVSYWDDGQNYASSGTIDTCFHCDKDISVKSDFGIADAKIDVLGYYNSKINYEPEAEKNEFVGASVIEQTASKDLVGYLGNAPELDSYLEYHVWLHTGGTYNMKIGYVSFGNREASLRINGSLKPNILFPSADRSEIDVQVELNAGKNTVRFFNESDWAPDFDRIDFTKQ